MTKPSHSLYYLEDHVPTLTRLKNFLPAFGAWTVRGESDEKKALKDLAAKSYDIYLIDEVLSEFQPQNKLVGSQVVDRLVKMPAYKKDSPVIIFSQLVTTEVLKQYGHGSDVWMKSFDYYEMRRVYGDLKLLNRSLLEILDHHRRLGGSGGGPKARSPAKPSAGKRPRQS